MEKNNLIHEFLTIDEVCSMLKISRSTYWRLSKLTPDFPKPIQIRSRRSKRYSVNDIKAWLEKSSNTTLTA